MAARSGHLEGKLRAVCEDLRIDAGRQLRLAGITTFSRSEQPLKTLIPIPVDADSRVMDVRAEQLEKTLFPIVVL
jgi:hypothetical protein